MGGHVLRRHMIRGGGSPCTGRVGLAGQSVIQGLYRIVPIRWRASDSAFVESLTWSRWGSTINHARNTFAWQLCHEHEVSNLLRGRSLLNMTTRCCLQENSLSRSRQFIHVHTELILSVPGCVVPIVILSNTVVKHQCHRCPS